MTAHLSLTRPLRVELLDVDRPGQVVWLEAGRYAVEPDGLPDGRSVIRVPDCDRWQRAAYPATPHHLSHESWLEDDR